MGTFDIKMPVRNKPIFPSMCVACERAEPDSTMELSILGSNTPSVAEGAAELLTGTLVGSPASRNTTTWIREIPICTGCESKLKWYHRRLKFATYTAWIPAILIALVMPGPWWLKIVIFFAVVIAPPILSMIFPPPFGATILNGKATYEFKSKRIADEFGRLNGVAETSEALA